MAEKTTVVSVRLNATQVAALQRLQEINNFEYLADAARMAIDAGLETLDGLANDVAFHRYIQVLRIFREKNRIEETRAAISIAENLWMETGKIDYLVTIRELLNDMPGVKLSGATEAAMRAAGLLV